MKTRTRTHRGTDRLDSVSELLRRAARDVRCAQDARDIAEQGHEGQRRNTIAFMRERDELQERLNRILAFVTCDERMTDWDSWRKAIAGGDAGSWPRDAFESVLSWIEGECKGGD